MWSNRARGKAHPFPPAGRSLAAWAVLLDSEVNSSDPGSLASPVKAGGRGGLADNLATRVEEFMGQIKGTVNSAARESQPENQNPKSQPDSLSLPLSLPFT